MILLCLPLGGKLSTKSTDDFKCLPLGGKLSTKSIDDFKWLPLGGEAVDEVD